MVSFHCRLTCASMKCFKHLINIWFWLLQNRGRLVDIKRPEDDERDSNSPFQQQQQLQQQQQQQEKEQQQQQEKYQQQQKSPRPASPRNSTFSPIDVEKLRKSEDDDDDQRRRYVETQRKDADKTWVGPKLNWNAILCFRL